MHAGIHEVGHSIQVAAAIRRALRRIEGRFQKRVGHAQLHELAEPPLVPVPAGDRLGHDRIVDHFVEDPVAEFLVARVGGHDPGQAEHPGADRVDRADRGRVELRDRPLEPPGHVGGRRRVAQEVGVELVAGEARRHAPAADQLGGHHEPAADPFAKLGRRVPREGGDEDLADPQVLGGGERLGHVGRDGMRLPGAGTGFDQRAVGKRSGGDVEGLDHDSR